MKKIIFEKIKFISFDENEFNKIIQNKGLFVFPAAPALANINEQENYYNALKKSDLAFFDSGFFVLLLKFLKKINVVKFSGYKFLEFLFKYLKKNKYPKIFLIDPNKNYSNNNFKFIKSLGYKTNNLKNYVAPFYNPKNFEDKKLLKFLNKFKPKFIIINIGGGTQEVLGLYLRDKLKFKCTILCTGAAISFFTGDQAPINSLVDKLYIGWLVRILFNPLLYFKRYLKAFDLIGLVLKSKIKVQKL